jgi:hypothetical protein
MNTTTGIKCANCKQHHPTVADVRACHEATHEGHAEQQAEMLTEQRYERWLEDGGSASEAIWASNEQDRLAEQMSDLTSVWRDGIAVTPQDDVDLPEPASTEPSATERQVNYLNTLYRERGERARTGLTKREASAEIARLLGQPKVADPAPATDMPDVPAGRYAVWTNEWHAEVDGNGNTVNADISTGYMTHSIKFYVVDRPLEGRWAGRTFVSVQASDEKHPVRNARDRVRVLDAIVAAGIKESMLLYGKEIGKCGHCGRTLTNDESRAAGIGPVCAGKMDW